MDLFTDYSGRKLPKTRKVTRCSNRTTLAADGTRTVWLNNDNGFTRLNFNDAAMIKYNNIPSGRNRYTVKSTLCSLSYNYPVGRSQVVLRCCWTINTITMRNVTTRLSQVRNNNNNNNNITEKPTKAVRRRRARRKKAISSTHLAVRRRGLNAASVIVYIDCIPGSRLRTCIYIYI